MRTAYITIAVAITTIAAGCNSASRTTHANAPTTVERIPIQHQSAEVVASQLAAATAQTEPTVRIVADHVTNSVIVSGTPDQIAQLQRQIATIDVEG